LSWHLALCELQVGNWAEALQLYQDAIALDRHSGGPQQKISDATALLWRSELAGHPRDTAAWRAMYGYANSALPRPGSGLADLHVILAQAVMGMKLRWTLELATWRIWRTRGVIRPALTFRRWRVASRGDFSTAIEALAPLAGESERIGGSRAQHDLIEFTLLKAYLNAHRLEEARLLLSGRRPEASGVPVIGVAAVQ
jgi:hypothetical protein